MTKVEDLNHRHDEHLSLPLSQSLFESYDNAVLFSRYGTLDNKILRVTQRDVSPEGKLLDCELKDPPSSSCR
jgi:hypothetical protein